MASVARARRVNGINSKGESSNDSDGEKMTSNSDRLVVVVGSGAQWLCVKS
ncbi:conserved hypothetical protein [Ricinus communis]|uniref:Uncharacterized protein n=1 Tax=Ricinus communis TaxID=3988 RepID=B9SA30_RICCO|nr:conserved hypothetical protein [Ricinus communis]